MKPELVEKIKSRGYWRINFEPLVAEQKLRLGECRDIVEKNSVGLRGWNYPHYPRRIADDSGLEPGANYYEGWIDWWSHLEFWRMYESGQFLHYVALVEDWQEKDGWTGSREERIEPKTVIGITGSIVYELTEIYEFLSRLATAGVYDEGVRTTVSLNNTKGRKLWIEKPGRRFYTDYKTQLETIEYTKKYSKEDLTTKPKELAFEAIIYICDRFGWHQPSVDVIKKDQANLLTRQI